MVQFGTEFALSQARYYFPAINAAALLSHAWAADAVCRGQARPAGQGIVFGASSCSNIVIMTGYVLPFTATVDEPAV